MIGGMFSAFVDFTSPLLIFHLSRTYTIQNHRGIWIGGDFVLYKARSPRHSSILGTLSLSKASMSPNPSGRRQLSGPRSRVHGDWFADDEAIADELADGLSGIGVGDLIDFIRVEPDLTLATTNHGGSQSLLSRKVDPVRLRMVVSRLLDRVRIV